MRKLKKGKRFSRTSSQRKALLQSLSASLFLKEKILTTKAKAKETARIAEKMITTARRGDLAARRRLLRKLPEKVVKKLIDEIAPRYKGRSGGYTRIIKIGRRSSDSAERAVLELVERRKRP